MTDTRGRTERQTEVAQARRRRDDTTIDGGQRLKLAIPPEVKAQLEREGRTPRWINDEGNRLVQMTKYDDYDPVDGVEPVYVGTTKEGKPMKAHLHSKPTDFIKEDEAKREGRRAETERAMLRGKVEGNPTAGAEGFYADDANEIQRGGRRSP